MRFALALLLFLPASAQAADFGNTTPCSVYDQFLKNHDDQGVMSAQVYVGQVFRDLDSEAEQKGLPGIASKTLGGMPEAAIHVMFLCKKLPSETVRHATETVYQHARDDLE